MMVPAALAWRVSAKPPSRASTVGVRVALASVTSLEMAMKPAEVAAPVVVLVALPVWMASMRTSPPTSSSTGSAQARVVVLMVASEREPVPATLTRNENAADDATEVEVTVAFCLAVITRSELLPVVLILALLA